MSLTIPSVVVAVDNIAIPTTRIKKFYCTDEDLTYGLGKCEVVIADPDGTAASQYPAFGTEQGLMKKITIAGNGRALFEGYIETVDPNSDSSGDTIILTGYSKAFDFANVFITKDYSTWIGIDANLFLNDVFTNAGRSFPHIANFFLATGAPAYPSSVASPGALTQKYVLDIIRDVCSVTGYAGTVDAFGNFYFFDPTDGSHNIPYVVQSVYPSNPSTPNDFKQGRATRNLQDTKTYLEVNGAGQGYDPFYNDGGLTNPLDNILMQWSASAASVVTTTTDVPPTSSTIYESIKVVLTSHNQTQIDVGFGFGPPTTIHGTTFGNLAWGTGTNAYTIKSDIDDTNYRLNLPFNGKTALYLLTSCSAGMTGTGRVWPIFTDINGNRASAIGNASAIGATAAPTYSIPTTTTWTEFSFPIPNAQDLALMGSSVGAGNYYFTDYALNPINSGFSFSSIVDLKFRYVAGGAPVSYPWYCMELAGVWFDCVPQYFTPKASMISSGLPYGRRDQAVNAGSEYVNQLDVQGYGDGVYPQYKNPMLRVPITVLVDPNVTFLKAGWLIGMNVPRWGFTPAAMPSYRTLQIRWDWGTGGLTCKLDLMPATGS